jgi:hypothetical protein
MGGSTERQSHGKEPAPWLVHQTVRFYGVRMAGILGEYVVGPFSAVPAADDQEVTGVVEVRQESSWPR